MKNSLIIISTPYETNSSSHASANRRTNSLSAALVCRGLLARYTLVRWPTERWYIHASLSGLCPAGKGIFPCRSERVLADYNYNPDQGYQMLKDEHLIKTASLSQIKTMLTFCVRGERFADGHWGEMIEKGHVRRLLERLNEVNA